MILVLSCCCCILDVVYDTFRNLPFFQYPDCSYQMDMTMAIRWMAFSSIDDEASLVGIVAVADVVSRSALYFVDTFSL